MSDRIKGIAMAWYACVVIASGLLRYFTAEGGEKGLWFGIALGLMAAVGAALFLLEKKKAATVVAGVAVLVVGGWFAYESLIVKGYQNAESRQLTILGFSMATFVLLMIPAKSNRSEPADDEKE